MDYRHQLLGEGQSELGDRHQLLGEGQSELGDFVQPNLNQDRPGPSVLYTPSSAAAVPAEQPVNTIIQRVLPPELWPHNFLFFSVILAVVLGVVNVLTLPLTLAATVLAMMGQHKSKRGNFSTAKLYSKITITLLMMAMLFCLFSLFVGFVSSGVLIPLGYFWYLWYF